MSLRTLSIFRSVISISHLKNIRPYSTNQPITTTASNESIVNDDDIVRSMLCVLIYNH